MNRRLSRWLMALYPRAFRDRYGQEVSSLTDELIGAGETTPLRAGFDLTFSAVSERGRALSRPRKVLATAMAFAVLLILGFALTGHQQARSSQTNWVSVGSACTANFRAAPGKGQHIVASVVTPQYRKKAGNKTATKRVHSLTVVISRPKCGMPGLACKFIGLRNPAPPKRPVAVRASFRKPRAALGKGWSVNVQVGAPARLCAVVTPARFRVDKAAHVPAK